MDMQLSAQGIPVVHTNKGEGMTTVVGSTACTTTLSTTSPLKRIL